MPIDEFNKIDEEYFTTILEDNFKFEGNIKIENSIMIKGAVSGNIECGDLLVIGPDCQIDANIKTKVLQCFGKVTGNIRVDNEAYFHSPSVITGDITAPVMTLENGCIVNGRVTMPAKK